MVSAVGVAAFLWPFLVQPAASAAGMAHTGDAPWLVLAIMPVLIVLVVAETTSGRLDAKGLAMMGVLATMGTALRIPGGPAGIEPIFFVFLPAARVFGRAFGFVLGAITLFASALLTAGVGPWLPFQMLAAGWFAYGAGCLPPDAGPGRGVDARRVRRRGSLALRARDGPVVLALRHRRGVGHHVRAR